MGSTPSHDVSVTSPTNSPKKPVKEVTTPTSSPKRTDRTVTTPTGVLRVTTPTGILKKPETPQTPKTPRVTPPETLLPPLERHKLSAYDSLRKKRPGSGNRPGSASWRPGSASWRPGSASWRPGSANWRPSSALRPTTPLQAAANAAKTVQWLILPKTRTTEVTRIDVAPPPPPSQEEKPTRLLLERSRGRPLFQSQEKDDVFAVDLTSAEGIADLWEMRPTSSSNHQRLRPVSPSKWSFPLLDATSANDIDQVRHYLRCGADVNSCHADGATALHLAAASGNTKIMKEVICSGASLNWAAADFSAPGHTAVSHGQTSSLLLLIQAHADLDQAGPDGRTMLHIAATHGYSQAVRALLNSRADSNVRDADKRTPLHEATERGNLSVVRMLTQHGADPHAKDRFGHSPLATAVKCRKDKVAIAVINAQAETCGIRDDESLQESLGSARSWIAEDGLF